MQYFKPTKRKVTVSIIAIFIGYAVVAFMLMFPSGVCGAPLCDPEIFTMCAEKADFSLISPYTYIPDGSGCSGCCDKTSLSTALIHLLVFITPGVVVYLVYSIAQVIRGKKNNLDSNFEQ